MRFNVPRTVTLELGITSNAARYKACCPSLNLLSTHADAVHTIIVELIEYTLTLYSRIVQVDVVTQVCTFVHLLITAKRARHLH